MNKWRRRASVRRTSKLLKYDKGHMTSVKECQPQAAGPDTHLNTSSRLRLPPSDCLRPFSSRKLGEYRLSNLVLPVLEACITPATNSFTISECSTTHNTINTNIISIFDQQFIRFQSGAYKNQFIKLKMNYLLSHDMKHVKR